jgi:hypothetical protein
MRIKILLLSFCIAFYNALSGQNPVETAKTNDFYPKARVVGLNMTPLITHFVPFNRADPKQAGPFLIRFRNYGKKNNAFRLGLGVSILSDDFTDNITDNFLHLQIGWEKRKNISQRWAYYRAFDFILSVGNNKTPGGNNDNDDTGGLGVGFGMGMEYAIARNVTLSTEAQLMLLLPRGIELVPPVGLFLNYYIAR